MKYKRRISEIEAEAYAPGMEMGVKVMDKMTAESNGIKDVYLSWNPHISPVSDNDSGGMVNNNKPIEIPYLVTPRGIEWIAKTDMIVTWEGAKFVMTKEAFDAEYEPKTTIITL